MIALIGAQILGNHTTTPPMRWIIPSCGRTPTALTLYNIQIFSSSQTCYNCVSFAAHSSKKTVLQGLSTETSPVWLLFNSLVCYQN